METIPENIFSSIKFQTENWYQGIGIQIQTLQQLTKLEGKYQAESKWDGIWAILFTGGGGKFYTRNQKERKNPLNNWPLKPGMALIGELGVGRTTSIQEKETLQHDFIKLHDIIIKDYQDLRQTPDFDRRKILEDWWTEQDQQTKERFILVQRHETNFINIFKKEKEGLVLKQNHPYYIGGGKKVKHWIKIKKEQTAEFIIMSREGDQITCGAYQNGTLTPLLHVTPEENILKNWPIAQNKIAEIAFLDRSLEAVAYKRLRPDKKTEECTWKCST